MLGRAELSAVLRPTLGGDADTTLLTQRQADAHTVNAGTCRSRGDRLSAVGAWQEAVQEYTTAPDWDPQKGCVVSPGGRVSSHRPASDAARDLRAAAELGYTDATLPLNELQKLLTTDSSSGSEDRKSTAFQALPALQTARNWWFATVNRCSARNPSSRR